MTFKKTILLTLLFLFISLPANALNINLQTTLGDNSLTIDETVTEFNLDLVWGSTPVSMLGWEKHFSIPSPFDLTGYSVNVGDIQDHGTYLRSLFITLGDPINITDPIVASLTFSVDPNAFGGDYSFSQYGSSGQNAYKSSWEDDVQYFDPNSFTVTIDKTTPVPEPATMLLLGSGLIGLVGLRRKFRK